MPEEEEADGPVTGSREDALPAAGVWLAFLLCALLVLRDPERFPASDGGWAGSGLLLGGIFVLEIPGSAPDILTAGLPGVGPNPGGLVEALQQTVPKQEYNSEYAAKRAH